MTVKKFSVDEVSDNHGPMNSVAKEHAKYWTKKKAWSEDLSQQQIHRIEVAKKKKEVTASKKQERKLSKDIIKHLDDLDT
jgi:hypothetical protein